MDATDQITARVEAYLIHVAETSTRWREWLQLGETASIVLDQQALLAFEQRAPQLTAALQELASRRQHLLDSAQAAGLPADSIQSLARSLPAWQRFSFRSAVEAVRQQLEHLRRMHTAAFILLHQSWQQSRETLRLLSTGSGLTPVYYGNDSLEGGGQILDAAL
jgi:hypothetical protein